MTGTRRDTHDKVTTERERGRRNTEDARVDRAVWSSEALAVRGTEESRICCG